MKKKPVDYTISNPELFKQVVSDPCFQKKIRGYVYKNFFKDEQTVDDIVQETLLKFAKSATSDFEFNHNSIQTYLLLTAKSICIDFIRKQKRNPITSLENCSHAQNLKDVSMSHHDDYEQLMIILTETIETLPEKQRLIISYKLQSMKVREIAAKLGISMNTVSAAYRYAQANIKKRIPHSLHHLYQEVVFLYQDVLLFLVICGYMVVNIF